MPFFIRKKLGKFKQKKLGKRKQAVVPFVADIKAKKFKKEEVSGHDEEITSDEEDMLSYEEQQHDSSFSEEEETQQEKKLRLTKKYLKELKNKESKNAELDETKDAVAERLKEEALGEAGHLQRRVAHEYEGTTAETLFILKGHKLSVTCVAVSSIENYVYSGSKDCSIIKWSLETGKKLKVVSGGKKGTESTHVGHTAHVLAIALSHDDKFLASGCQNCLVNIWNPETMEHLKTFKGHRGAITGLTFHRGSHQLISASADRSLKLWNLDEMGYVETLFGHQDSITGIDSFHGETAVTSGGRDNTARIWKIVEESQLVFQGHGASIDCICVTGPHHFVSGADDGSIALWGINKKKPLSKLTEVHGYDAETGNPHWITSVCALLNSDLLASGSKGGEIKLWRRDDEKQAIELVCSLPVKGFVNAVCFSPSGKLLIAGLGQEHKLGRWWRVKDAKNVVVVYRWPKTRTQQ